MFLPPCPLIIHATCVPLCDFLKVPLPALRLTAYVDARWEDIAGLSGFLRRRRCWSSYLHLDSLFFPIQLLLRPASLFVPCKKPSSSAWDKLPECCACFIYATLTRTSGAYKCVELEGFKGVTVICIFLWLD